MIEKKYKCTSCHYCNKASLIGRYKRQTERIHGIETNDIRTSNQVQYGYLAREKNYSDQHQFDI